MTLMHIARLPLIGFVLAALAAPLAAQDSYPNRPVTIVVPFAPGGGTDILARMVGQKLEQRLGKPFLIENRAGAGTITGANGVAKATPDGYTLLMAPSPTMAFSPTIYKNLPFDPAADFIPLALVAQVPFVLVVNPSLPVHSVADLIKLAKEKPGQLSFGSGGPGTSHHLFAELFKSMTGTDMLHVPYRGSLPILTDVAGGHLPLTFVDFGPAVALLQAGKVRPIGITTKARVASFPDIPPIAEAGVPGFDAAAWQMLSAPAKTPRPIVDKLFAEVKSILATPEFTASIVNDGMLPMDNPSVAALQAFVKSEIVRWGKVVQQAGLAGTQ
jgi:tripartite-type tricarboxylate transporter receptor subunit TctC